MRDETFGWSPKTRTKEAQNAPCINLKQALQAPNNIFFGNNEEVKYEWHKCDENVYLLVLEKSIWYLCGFFASV